jgi:hypothetical protein
VEGDEKDRLSSVTGVAASPPCAFNRLSELGSSFETIKLIKLVIETKEN